VTATSPNYGTFCRRKNVRQNVKMSKRNNPNHVTAKTKNVMLRAQRRNIKNQKW
jgi:hypothetical protein